MAKLTVDLALKYHTQGVVGIDISDLSTIGDINAIIPELLRANLLIWALMIQQYLATSF